MKRVKAVDFDATLAHHTGDCGADLGEPVPAMLDRVKGFLQDGYEVRILTARVSSSHPNVEGMRRQIEDWTEKHLGQRLEVTAEKKSDIEEIYDDRARQVIPNRGVVLGAPRESFENGHGILFGKPGGHARYGK